MIELKIELEKKGNKLKGISKGSINGHYDILEAEMVEVLKVFDKASSEALREAIVDFCDYKIEQGEDSDEEDEE